MIEDWPYLAWLVTGLGAALKKFDEVEPNMGLVS
jgi:hypothetical protein